MKKLTVFYLEGCPYCRKAVKAVKELRAENPAWARLDMAWIEESASPEIAERYDYYFVPSVFLGEEKLYECSPAHDGAEIRRQMERCMRAACAEDGEGGRGNRE